MIKITEMCVYKAQKVAESRSTIISSQMHGALTLFKPKRAIQENLPSLLRIIWAISLDFLNIKHCPDRQECKLLITGSKVLQRLFNHSSAIKNHQVESFHKNKKTQTLNTTYFSMHRFLHLFQRFLHDRRPADISTGQQFARCGLLFFFFPPSAIGPL